MISRQDAKTPRERVGAEPDGASDAAAARVVDAAFEVHWHLGPGFVESVYENALCHELTLRNVVFERQVSVAVRYKGALVGRGYADLVVGGLVVVELKALPALAPVHTSQLISYLKATGLRLGLLVNFGERRLKSGCRRVVLTR